MSDRAFFAFEGKDHFVPAVGLAKLIRDEVLFANSRRYLDPECFGGGVKPETIVLFVVCNDIFAWASADAEEITMDEVPALYRLWRANKAWGPVRWVCRKRNEQPQFPVARAMKAAGQWDAEMEALPPNSYDAANRRAAKASP